MAANFVSRKKRIGTGRKKEYFIAVKYVVSVLTPVLL